MTELERARQELKHKLCCYKDCTCERHVELDRYERLVRADERAKCAPKVVVRERPPFVISEDE